MPAILFAEDEAVLGQLVKDALEREADFRVTWVRDGETALRRFKELMPDICILDVMMPLLDGFAVAKRMRVIDEHLPIIFLTARSQTADVVKGFESGGNDYLKKPFSVEELVVRVRALLKRSIQQPAAAIQDVYRIGQYEFSPAAQVLKSPQIKYNLSSRETKLLHELVLHKNNLMNRKAVLLRLWGDDNIFNTRNMDVYIAKLRKYFADDPSISIVNIRGYGYKLIEEQP